MQNRFFYLSVLLIIFPIIILGGCYRKSNTGEKPMPIGDGGVYKSLDGGENFYSSSIVGENKTISNFSILDIAIDKNNPDIIYIGTEYNGIYKSENGGKKWMVSKSPFSTVYRIRLNPQDQNQLYIIADSGGERALFKTMDGGVNWQRLLVQRNAYIPKVLDIIMDNKNPDVLYVSDSTGGIYKSTDGGLEWKTLGWSDEPVVAMLMDSLNNKKLYLTTSNYNVFISNDGGGSFTSVIGGQNSAYKFSRIYSMAVSGISEGVFYVLSDQGLFVSRDGGNTYKRLNTLLPPEGVVADFVALDPHNDNIIYVIAGKVLYKSIDDGEHWQVIPLPIKWRVGKLLVHPKDSNIVFMGLLKVRSKKGIGVPMPF